MLKYYMYMQIVGLFVAVILCGLGIQYFMRHLELVQLDKETEITTSSGATFKIEKGWFFIRIGDVITLQDPDKELTYSLIENQEITADQAVQSAWKKINPNFDYVFKGAVPSGPKDEWEQQVSFEYGSQSQDDKIIRAYAQLCNGRWYVKITQSPKQTLQRRSAGIMLINSSFKIPGCKPESFAGKTAHKLDQDRLQELNDFIEKARIACKIPGVAIGIVQNGNIVLEKGFGVRNLETQQTVTPETLFMIGSITKPLTTCMMAKLIDDNFFAWDTPVTKLLPSFLVDDKSLTQKLKMIDMVSNANGMPPKRTENFFDYDNVTPESRIAAMKNEKPTTKLGETFQYSNAMVAAGGYIAAHCVYPHLIFNQAYQAVMKKYLFNLIGMQSTTFDFETVAGENHADPYNRDVYCQVEQIKEDPLFYKPKLPSGGAWSNVIDMNQYLLFELNKGINLQEQRIVSEKNLLKRRIPQIKISEGKNYGLGLIIENSYGVTTINHGGSVNGFGSYLLFIPEHNIGYIILTNMKGHFSTLLIQSVGRKLMEILFDGKSKAQDMLNFGLVKEKIEYEKKLQDIDFHPSSLWISHLIGSYLNPERGVLIIRPTKNGIELDARLWKANLMTVKKTDGSLELLVADGPCVGISVIPQENSGHIELVIDEGQRKQVFTKINI